MKLKDSKLGDYKVSDMLKEILIVGSAGSNYHDCYHSMKRLIKKRIEELEEEKK